MHYLDGPEISVGDRVELHPGTDAFASGDRYGNVVKITSKTAHVKMDRSRLTRCAPPRLLMLVEKVSDRRTEDGEPWKA
jgi:hypothetical protein